MWSYLTFKFLNPLLNTGYLSPLQEEDLYDLPKQNSPTTTSKSWKRRGRSSRRRTTRAKAARSCGASSCA